MLYFTICKIIFYLNPKNSLKTLSFIIKIKPLENELKFIFITSECYLRLSDNEFDHPIKHGDDELTIIITKSVNTKCERCWHLNESVGKIKDTPTICQRCFDNVHGDGECRAYA